MSTRKSFLKYTILYVDDELIHLYAFKASYKDRYKIITARSAEEGLAILENTNIHLVVSDQRMDNMNGIEFLKIVKVKWPHIIRIMLTAYTDSSSIKKAINEAEVFRYLAKPFKDEAVIPNINQALETYQLKADLEASKKLLGNAEKKLIKIVETARDAIITINDEFDMVMVNDATCTMFGYTKKELLGQSVNLLLEKNIWEGDNKEIENFSKRKDSSAVMGGPDMDLYGIASDGNKIYIESTLSRMNVDGKIYYNAIIRDVTENKLAKKLFKEKLEFQVYERTKELENSRIELAQSLAKEKELVELKSRFVATASHQFRTPLTVIQTNMGMLAMQMESMDTSLKMKFEKAYNRIKGQIEKMTVLMNDVLILGKIDAGRVNTKMEPISIVTICKNLIGNFNEIQDDGRKLNFSIKGREKKIELDAKMIGHALSNIISNAFKFSKGRVSPELSVFYEKAEIIIKVKDYGVGIPKSDIKQLFEPFFRGTNVNDIPGTGLGSAITKEYIELNEGEISINSYINKGTEVIITFKY